MFELAILILTVGIVYYINSDNLETTKVIKILYKLNTKIEDLEKQIKDLQKRNKKY